MLTELDQHWRSEASAELGGAVLLCVLGFGQVPTWGEYVNLSSATWLFTVLAVGAEPSFAQAAAW